MIIKKALFGGYKRKVVDQMITQWSEEKTSTQTKIGMMDLELGLSKETAKRSIDQLSSDIKQKEKAIELLRSELDQKKALGEQLAGVVETKNAEIANLSAQIEQMDRTANNREQKTDDAYSHGRTDNKDDAYDEGIRRIGQLYVDAKNYTDMIKSDAQIKTSESVDLFFDEIRKSREEYIAVTNQISQKRRAISELIYEMDGSLKMLRTNLDKFDEKSPITDDPYVKLEEMKEKLKSRINNGFNPFAMSWDDTISTPANEAIAIKESFAVNNELENKIAEFASQIEELRSTLQLQQEMIDSQAKIHEQSLISEQELLTSQELLSSDENLVVPEPKIADSSDNELLINEKIVPAPKRILDSEADDHEIRSEQERLEREKYRLYFSEVEKKHKRDSTGGHRYTISNSHKLEENRNNSANTPREDMQDIENVPYNNETKNTKPPVSVEPAGIHGKKPSIKEILDKYANLK